MARSVRTDLAVHHFGRPAGQAPTVVLLHGAIESALCWADAITRWENDYHIVAVDARGHGESPGLSRPEEAYFFSESMTTDMIAVLTDAAEAAGHPVLLIGHSMGARIAAFAAASVPHLVCGLVLEDPSWWVPEEGPNPWLSRDHQFDDPFDQVNEVSFAELGDLVDKAYPNWSEAERRALTRAMVQVDGEMMERRLYKKRRAWSPTARQLAHGRRRVPTMLLVGSHEVIVEEPSRDLLAECAPEIEVVIVEGAGHCVRRDQPETYHRHVDAFLNTHSAGRAR